MVELTHEAGVYTLSGDHLVFAAKASDATAARIAELTFHRQEAVPARSIEAGDFLWLAPTIDDAVAKPVLVLSVATVEVTGVQNVRMVSGRLVVDGIVSTWYTVSDRLTLESVLPYVRWLVELMYGTSGEATVEKLIEVYWTTWQRSGLYLHAKPALTSIRRHIVPDEHARATHTHGQTSTPVSTIPVRFRLSQLWFSSAGERRSG